MALRLEVMSIRGQQAVTDGERLIEETVDAIKAAKERQDALLEARVRMAEYFAGQEKAFADAQAGFSLRQAMPSEGGER
jgi:hypothetical protein